MDDNEFLPRSIDERRVNASHETSADSEGAYTFVVHGGQKIKKKKEVKDTRVGPPVDVKLSDAAKKRMSGEQALPDKENVEDQTDESNETLPPHKINIKI